VTIPRPTEVTALADLSGPLDAATWDERLAWVRSLVGKEQYALYALAQGSPVHARELVRGDRVVRHYGRNGLPLFTNFEKRCAQLGDTVLGYNEPEITGPIGRIYRWVTGPGHYVAYDSPEVPGEVWIDYRRLPTAQHPEFPPLQSNESGLPTLVFGDMVDILRRVSRDVFIGDAFKGKYPRETPTPFLARVARIFGTAPFVLLQEPAPPGDGVSA
jgi:hypothetical protein